MHRILKTVKKYGYNISSVNGVAEFVKERLYPYNGTEQVLLDGIALECFNIEGQGSMDWSVLNFIYWQKVELDWLSELVRALCKTAMLVMAQTVRWDMMQLLKFILKIINRHKVR